jgi:hypothetical protein
MMTSATAIPPVSEPRPLLRTRGRWVTLVCLLLFAILLSQAFGFTAFVGQLGGWQFARFGRYFPALTIIIPLIIIAILWMLGARLLARARHRRNPDASPLDQRVTLGDGARLFLLIGWLSGLGALAVFGHFLQLPDGDGAIRTVNVTATRPVTFSEGPVRLVAAPPLGPVARYVEDLMVTRRTTYFVPVGIVPHVGVGRPRHRAPFNLFVEVERIAGDESTDPRLPATFAPGGEHDGILRADALPPEIAQMYRDVGYPVAAQSAVLFRSADSAQRGVIVLMAEFIAFGLIALLFGLWMRRVDRRRRAALARERAGGGAVS